MVFFFFFPILLWSLTFVKSLDTPSPTQAHTHTRSHSSTPPPSSFNPSSIPVHHTSKHARTLSSSHAHNHGNVAFSSFGFGGPDVPIPSIKQTDPTPTSPGSPGSQRKKKHGFFHRHDSSASANEKEKDKLTPSKEKSQSGSLRTRVFSTPSPHIGSESDKDKDTKSKSGTATISPVVHAGHVRSKSEEESSRESSEYSHSHKDTKPVQGVISHRAESPLSPSKLARKHSRFETYVIDPLERRASKIVHKLRHNDSNHSLDHHSTGETQETQ